LEKVLCAKLREEDNMAVKVLIKRKFKKADVIEISKAIREARLGAMEQEGYISSETMWDHDHANKVVVASMWQTMENWKNWKKSPRRKAIQEKYKDSLDGPIEYEFYILGIYPH
jgi:heme-degrading monooxygenase HmoA